MTLHCEVTTDKYLVGLLKISNTNHYEQLQVTKAYISSFIINVYRLSRNRIIYRKSRLDKNTLFSYKSLRNPYT